MTFVVVFVALIVERFFDWSHLRIWVWLPEWQRLVINKLCQPSAYVNLFLSILPIVFAVWLVNHLLHSVMYGFLSLIFEVLILLYTLGPQNLWADTFGCVNAIEDGDMDVANTRLKNAFGMSKFKSPQSLHRSLLAEIFVAANRRVVSVTFWFVVLGPVGAVFYRLIALSSGVQENRLVAVSALSQPAQAVESVLDWLPSRIMTLFFALGGQFVQVLKLWQKKVSQGLYSSDDLMSACGFAALGVAEKQDIATDCKLERSALNLIDRSFVMALIVLALIILV